MGALGEEEVKGVGGGGQQCYLDSHGILYLKVFPPKNAPSC